MEYRISLRTHYCGVYIQQWPLKSGFPFFRLMWGFLLLCTRFQKEVSIVKRRWKLKKYLCTPIFFFFNIFVYVAFEREKLDFIQRFR